MPVFKYSRLGGVQQVPTDEEIAARAKKDDAKDAHEEIDLPHPPGYKVVEPLKRAQRLSEDSSAAFRALFRDMFKQGVPWCKKYIAKIEDMEELSQVRAKEQEHPKYDGGRAGIFSAIMEREEELRPKPEAEGEPEAEEEPEEEAEEEEEKPEAEPETFACPDCDFRAGSPEGLDAHVEANHAEI